MSGRGIIYAEKPQQCDECNEIRELRPYGPGGKIVCYQCIQDHPSWGDEAQARMEQHIFGTPLPDKYLTS